MIAKLAALFAVLTAALNMAAHVRVALWPGWIVPLPALLVALAALVALTAAARAVLAVLGNRVPLPYIAVAVTWRGVRS
jgi:hypothetical protein